MSDYCVLIGDCLDTLKTLPDQSVHTCVTSPPYFGLRDYGQDGQIGLEPTPDEFVEALVRVFREVRRVLRDDGTVWLNLGDSYARPPAKGGSGPSGKNRDWYGENYGQARGAEIPDGIKQKDLIGIPWMVAFALRADGWYLRQDIIWHKPNPMPESVRDRCTKAHEYIFLLSKGPRYFYDHEAAKEPSSYQGPAKPGKQAQTAYTGLAVHSGRLGVGGKNGLRNRRSVWTVSTRPYRGAHFATFPPDLIEPCILAGTSERGHCPECGERWVRQVDKSTRFEGSSARAGRSPDQINGSGKHIGGVNGGNKNLKSGPVITSHTTGWAPACECACEPVPDVVLDPFGGSGTTAGVAVAHGRDAVLCELSPDYAQLIPERVEWVQEYYRRRRAAPVTIVPDDDTPEGEAPGQIALFDAPTCSITEPFGLEVDHGE